MTTTPCTYPNETAERIDYSDRLRARGIVLERAAVTLSTDQLARIVAIAEEVRP